MTPTLYIRTTKNDKDYSEEIPKFNCYLIESFHYVNSDKYKIELSYRKYPPNNEEDFFVGSKYVFDNLDRENNTFIYNTLGDIVADKGTSDIVNVNIDSEGRTTVNNKNIG